MKNTAKRILIKVTQKHINKGQRNSSTSCPVSNAVCETLELQSFNVSTGPNNICVLEDGICKVFNLPRSAYQFIMEFDKEGKKAVNPFNFYLGKELY